LRRSAAFGHTSIVVIPRRKSGAPAGVRRRVIGTPRRPRYGTVKS
jgi:hypothetical protein